MADQPDARPVIVAYDGSPASEAAVRQAATLFAGRPLVTVTVWEPGFAVRAGGPMAGEGGLGYVPPAPAQVAAVARAESDHGAQVPPEGARLARDLGATAEPLALP